MGAKRGKDGLTTLQRRFVAEYLLEPIAARAAERAGYSKRSARELGHVLLGKPAVRAAIEAAEAKRAARVELKADEVIRALMRVAYADLRRGFDAENRLLPIRDLPDDLACALSGIDNEEIREGRQVIGNVRKVRLSDRIRALELLGKHLKLWVDRQALEGVDGEALTVVVKKYAAPPEHEPQPAGDVDASPEPA